MTPIFIITSLGSYRMTAAHLKLTLAALGVLVSLSLPLAYVQARLNTPGLAPGGEFNANRAFADLKRLVSFGPRQPGSRALEQEPRVHHRRTPRTRYRDGFGLLHGPGTRWSNTMPMTNLVAEIPGNGSAVVIIAGHHDTKHTNFPFLGASDGGSHAAFLLEMHCALREFESQLQTLPWRRGAPQVGFFAAMERLSFLSSGVILGQPGRRRESKRQCQRIRRDAGVTTSVGPHHHQHASLS